MELGEDTISVQSEEAMEEETLPAGFIYLSASLLCIYATSAAVKTLAGLVFKRRSSKQHSSIGTDLPPSPPPLAKLSELDSQDTTPAPTTTSTHTPPPFSFSKTILTTSKPSSCATTPLTDSTVRDSMYSPTPYASPTPDPPAAAASPKGWDPALLQQSAANEASISSVDGLLQSAELQQHVRSTTSHGNFDLHMKQMETKLNTYKDLRAFDRDNFVHAYTRKDIKNFEEVSPPLPLLVIDHASSTVFMGMLLLACLRSSSWGPGLLGAWLAMQALLAWRASHHSLLACASSVYCVFGDDSYAAHDVAAGPLRTAAATLIDLLLASCSLGVSGVVSLVLVCVMPLRQSLGQRLMGVYPVREVATTAETPLYPPSPSKLAAKAQPTHVAHAAHTTPREPLTVHKGPMMFAASPGSRTLPSGTHGAAASIRGGGVVGGGANGVGSAPSSAFPGFPRHSTAQQLRQQRQRQEAQEQVTPEQGSSLLPPTQPVGGSESGVGEGKGLDFLRAENPFSARRSLPRSPLQTIYKRKNE